MSEQVGCFWVDMTACTYIHTMSTKNQAKNLYAITENCSRIFIRFGVQLQQSMLKGVIKLSSSPDMYIHYLVMVTVHMYKCLLARLRWNGSTKSVQNLGSREDWLTAIWLQYGEIGSDIRRKFTSRIDACNSATHLHFQFWPQSLFYCTQWYVLMLAAPTVWNSLPADIRAGVSYGSFIRQLKSFLF